MINEEIMDTMLRMAKDAQQNGFLASSAELEGACILTSDGTLYTATNMENTTGEIKFCAAQVAMAKAIADGKLDYDALALVSTREDLTMVCQDCHHIITRYGIPDIILGNLKGEVNTLTAEELKPCC